MTKPKKPPIVWIGMGHHSRTGKDSLANFLLLALKRRKIAALKRPFAWKIKDIAHQLYWWAGVKPPEYYDTKAGEAARDVVLPLFGMTPVELWVKIGTPLFREGLYDGTWVDYVTKYDGDARVVIVPDVRFPNEVESLRALDAKLIKVVRPGRGAKTDLDKQLEQYDGWDAVVGRSGKMDDLQAYAKRVADWIKNGGEFPKE